MVSLLWSRLIAVNIKNVNQLEVIDVYVFCSRFACIMIECVVVVAFLDSPRLVYNKQTGVYSISYASCCLLIVS